MTISKARRGTAASDRAMVAIGSVLMLASAAAPARLDAQTDYYNTDAGRPIRIEDAYAIERRGLEIQAAPLRLERSKGGVYRWGLEPELAAGILPRTQLEVGVPLVYTDAGLGRHTTGLAGVDVSGARIGERWRDHVRFAMLAEDWRRLRRTRR